MNDRKIEQSDERRRAQLWSVEVLATSIISYERENLSLLPEITDH